VNNPELGLHSVFTESFLREHDYNIEALLRDKLKDSLRWKINHDQLNIEELEDRLKKARESLKSHSDQLQVLTDNTEEST